MAKFIYTDGEYINMDNITGVIWVNDGSWVARIHPNGLRKLGRFGNVRDEMRISVATGTIIPAQPDTILHHFILDIEEEVPTDLVHQSYPIIAWAINAGQLPIILTPHGEFTFLYLWNEINALYHNGKYIDMSSMVYENLEDIRKELVLRRKEEEKKHEYQD